MLIYTFMIFEAYFIYILRTFPLHFVYFAPLLNGILNHMNKTIIFPNLHITLENVGQNISIGGFSIAFYGMIIGCGMLIAMLYILHEAKRLGYSEDAYMDVTLVTIVCGVIGARLYYVMFRWDLYKDNLLSILNLRTGGLGIYGGIIVGLITVVIMCKIKKLDLLNSLDILLVGVIIGQIMGRWGNFFNREAFGEYTNNLFAMQLPRNAVRAEDITDSMLANITSIDGVEFISVHPTFLYESMWNVMILLIMLFISRHKKFSGEVAVTYFIGYGIGRFIIEGLRTDQLKIWGSNIPISQVVAIIMIVIGIAITVTKISQLHQKNSKS